MKLVASLIVKDEVGRYLEPCIGHLQEFCDEIVCYDDGSTDGTADWLTSAGVTTIRADDGVSRFFEHEGHARQRLLEHTLAAEPTHVLAIDADELITDGSAVRAAVERGPQVPVWSASIEEIWCADETCLCVREDGGWRAHPLPLVWAVAQVRRRGPLRIPARQLACGRYPGGVSGVGARTRPSGVELLHFGWANVADRARRHARYATHDGGRFHASQHLGSILWPDERVTLRDREWPPGLERYRDAILERTVSTAVAA